jgi:hypothetical protein
VATLTEHIRLLDQDRDLLRKLRSQALANSTRLTWSGAAERLADAYLEGVARFRRAREGSK